MQRFLAFLVLFALLATPVLEATHFHEVGHSHEECPACHLESNPGDLVRVTATASGMLDYHTEKMVPAAFPCLPADPLSIAPKTSPPRALS